MSPRTIIQKTTKARLLKRSRNEMTSCRTRRNDRVVRVERRVKIGSAAQLEDALVQSEDSEHLNTSFVERLNLTIRQGSAYLRRCSPCHARGEDQLRRHVELLRCHYNFVRPHRALKFGRETRTPAMQAGVVSTRMTWSDIFTAPGLSRHLRVVVVRILVIVPHGHWHNCAANLLVAARTKAGGVINSKTAQAPVAGQSVTRPWRGRGARRGPQCGFQATGRCGWRIGKNSRVVRCARRPERESTARTATVRCTIEAGPSVSQGGRAMDIERSREPRNQVLSRFTRQAAIGV